MTQEEKAKAYDEALNWMRELYPGLHGATKEDAEHYFPELRESEDERIRKYLISELKVANSVGELKFSIPQPTREDCIAYLEKQKEQKPNIELIQRSWYMEGYHDREFGKEPMWIIKTGKGGPKHELNPKYGQPLADEQKPNYCHYGGDPIVELCKYCSAACSARLTEEQKPELVQHPPITFAYNSNASRDERLKAALLALLNSDLLKVKEGGYFTKQDLIEWVERIPTDKPAEWSEEDSKRYISIGTTLGTSEVLTKEDYDANMAWLRELVNAKKYLRPSWKPSEEHLSALLAVFNDPNNIGSQTCQLALTDLYEQLKKL